MPPKHTKVEKIKLINIQEVAFEFLGVTDDS